MCQCRIFLSSVYVIQDAHVENKVFLSFFPIDDEKGHLASLCFALVPQLSDHFAVFKLHV